MIEETATVISVEGETAEVETQRRSSCGGCEAKAGCGTSLIASVFGKRRSLIRVSNPIQAQPGEQVVIGLSEGPFLRAAMAVYLVPLLAMIGGAIVAEWLAIQSASTTTELASLIGGLLGLGAGLAWLYRFSRKQQGEGAYRAVVLRRAGVERISVRFP